MKKLITVLFVTFCTVFTFAQKASLEDLKTSQLEQIEDVSSRVQLAMSNADYRVTAGDVYKLAFAAGTTSVSYPILVDSSYKVRVANLAVIDASGKTFMSLKRQVEDIVTKNYPMSGVQFTLVTPATFHVKINGEVKKSVEKSAWALARLSSVLGDVLTSYSSVRDVTVTSANGKISYYDLFKAERSGDFSQDPYVRPGDVITISKIRRLVTVSGEVERPGTYELMKDENLKDLINYYANGLTELADTSRITLVRNRNSNDISGNTVYLDSTSISSNMLLNNGDRITVGSIQELVPSIIVEGIINNPKPNADNADSLEKEQAKDTMYRTAVKFYSGETYASFVRRIAYMYSSYSDLKNAHVQREGSNIALNIEDYIYDFSKECEILVQANDVLLIPFTQHFEKVLINGEVTKVHEEEAWPLRRISSIIGDNLTPYSSTRNVQVKSVDGIIRTYDLFAFDRDGDITQNPYVRAGETVTVQRMERKVTLGGAVERPGTYQLLQGENLYDLIEYYGNGLAPLADTSRIELTRTFSQDDKSGKKIYLNQTDLDNNYELLSYDSVTVSSYSSLKPVMFMEGAIKAKEGTELEASDKVTVRFEKGTNYAYLVRAHASYFTGTSDTENAYIIRKGEVIPININPMLYDASYYSDLTVEENDTLMIPFKQFFVSVAGAVYNPGRYPYIPDRTYSYYIGLAGGFIKNQNANGAVEITDINGKILGLTDIITPECNITAKTNSFTYYFNQYAPVFTTILSVVSTTISIILAAKK